MLAFGIKYQTAKQQPTLTGDGKEYIILYLPTEQGYGLSHSGFLFWDKGNQTVELLLSVDCQKQTWPDVMVHYLICDKDLCGYHVDVLLKGHFGRHQANTTISAYFIALCCPHSDGSTTTREIISGSLGGDGRFQIKAQLQWRGSAICHAAWSFWVDVCVPAGCVSHINSVSVHTVCSFSLLGFCVCLRRPCLFSTLLKENS